ncbi:MAG: hypothetical protein HY279_10680 [Nitrospinae bacterium]|nr:hypothetical protein [Nitrospinota bacterium]
MQLIKVVIRRFRRQYVFCLLLTVYCLLLTPYCASETKAGSGTEMPHEQRYVIHNVSAGDNLYLLSAYYYGNARQWEKIFNENRDIIKNPNVLEIGAKLKIPVDAEWSPRYSIEEFRKMTEKEK